MAEPPPRDPRDPSEDETVVADDWGPETVRVEHTEVIPPRRPRPTLWPWLLALLLLVLGGLGVAYALTREDDEEAAPTTAVTRETSAEAVVVPDVVGTTSSEATETLRDAGFEVNVVAVPSDQPSGQVVAQNPAAGSDAPDGSTVRINVAEERAETTTATTAATTAAPARAPATVPDVDGQELADAARAFAAEWLKVAVRYVPSDEPAGRVVAQARSPGTVLGRGDSVQLNVSTGVEPLEAASVPAVTGQRQDRGRSTLEQAGFEVLALDPLGGGEVRREDTIGSQSPAAAASIPRGSLVLLYVGS